MAKAPVDPEANTCTSYRHVFSSSVPGTNRCPDFHVSFGSVSSVGVNLRTPQSSTTSNPAHLRSVQQQIPGTSWANNASQTSLSADATWPCSQRPRRSSAPANHASCSPQRPTPKPLNPSVVQNSQSSNHSKWSTRLCFEKSRRGRHVVLCM